VIVFDAIKERTELIIIALPRVDNFQMNERSLFDLILKPRNMAIYILFN